MQCSVTCGEGQQLRLVECYNVTSQEKIPDQFCDGKSKPEELKLCQTMECPVWVTSEWIKVHFIAKLVITFPPAPKSTMVTVEK